MSWSESKIEAIAEKVEAGRRLSFEEGVELILKAWTQTELKHAGTYYEVGRTAIYPRPLQQPGTARGVGGSDAGEHRQRRRHPRRPRSILPLPSLSRRSGRRRSRIRRRPSPPG